MITTALKYLFFIGVLAATIPFWLPTSLGGQTSYHFILTDSMKGTVDPGAFVILRSSDQYNEGDVVAYRQKFDDDDTEFTILHRIIARMPDGGFITKGDAVEQSESIEASQITGRMIAALPALGFLPGAFRAAPLIVGTALMLMLVVGGAAFKKDKPSNAKKTARSTDLFIPASIVVVASIPYATLGVGEFLPTGAEAILEQLGGGAYSPNPPPLDAPVRRHSHRPNERGTLGWPSRLDHRRPSRSQLRRRHAPRHQHRTRL